MSWFSLSLQINFHMISVVTPNYKPEYKILCFKNVFNKSPISIRNRFCANWCKLCCLVCLIAQSHILPRSFCNNNKLGYSPSPLYSFQFSRHSYIHQRYRLNSTFILYLFVLLHNMFRRLQERQHNTSGAKRATSRGTQNNRCNKPWL
jgi:hypothetical protein